MSKLLPVNVIPSDGDIEIPPISAPPSPKTNVVTIHSDPSENKVKEQPKRTAYQKWYYDKPKWKPLLGDIILILIIGGGLGLVTFLPPFFTLYIPNQLRMNNIVQNTEQLFLPSTNQTILCGQNNCTLYTFDYGVINFGQRVVSRSVYGMCGIADSICYDTLETIYGQYTQQVYYDVRYPQSTFTTDPDYLKNINGNRNAGILIMSFGCLILFITTILLCCTSGMLIDEIKKYRKGYKENNQTDVIKQ